MKKNRTKTSVEIIETAKLKLKKELERAKKIEAIENKKIAKLLRDTAVRQNITINELIEKFNIWVNKNNISGAENEKDI